MNTKQDISNNEIDIEDACTCSIFRSIAQGTDFKDHIGPYSDFDIIRTATFNHVMTLCEIERWVTAALSTSKPAYLVNRHINGTVDITPTTLGKKLGHNFRQIRGNSDYTMNRNLIESEISGYRLSPNAQLFFNTLPQGDFWFTDPYRAVDTDKIEAEYFNEFLDELRKNSKSETYKGELKRRRKQAENNHKSLTEYINRLFEHYAKILVIRVDLAYITDYKNLISLDEANAHREKLLANRRHNEMFKHEIGFAWGLEYGPNKGGYHYHFFFFYNGEHAQQGIQWADAIGNYWINTVTEGKGHYFNCNKNINNYEYPGIGKIDHRDSELRRNLIEMAAPYITKKDLFIEIKSEDCQQNKFRTFGRGEMLPPRVPGSLGRPREKFTL